MKNNKDMIYIYAGRAGMVLLFAFTACYVFAALGFFSLGIVTFPSALLGHFGMLTVTSDIAPDALLLITGGILLLGGGLSFGIIPLCAASYDIFRRFVKSSALRRERMYNNEEDQTS